MFEEDHEESVSGGYWPSVTDLFMTLFIISIVILAVVFFISSNQGLGPLFGEIRKPTNELRAVLDLPRIRETQSPYQVVAAVKETSSSAVKKITELIEKIAAQEAELARLKESIADPLLITKLREEIDKLKEEKTNLAKRIAELEKMMKESGDPNLSKEELLRKIAELEKENKELKRESRSVVVGPGRKEFRFDSGSPVIKEDFSTALRYEVEDGQGGFNQPPFPQIANEVINRHERINTLEIIGHTDGVPLSASGNLDQKLPELLAGELGGFQSLVAGSNNDLGLLRALALKQEWLDYVKSFESIKSRELLMSLDIRCYSAGQTILPVTNHNPSPSEYRKNDDKARRIEMRLTKVAKDENE